MAGKKKLVGPWRQIHGAIWLIGLAILFWKGWWWPGILVLVAISAITEAVIQIAVPQAAVEEVPAAAENLAPETPIPATPPPVVVAGVPQREHRADLLPSECPKCGAPVRGNEVRWTGVQSADCPYCGANLPMQQA
jgi:hypothetical protein